ncbi:hypothetical protein [Halopseudomonas aestusnigri]|uniref:Seed maturation protein n=1 Tax=Halopseudomonas aestusnigri TaxID=857252 RepID=A0AAQ1GAB9_9GAMM|nr:hypothetical protein [Halopseudomonas aestusnigri]SEG74715.1 hypothetical protein SAMN05216586_1256 [Halopseudomonas aestusnigri]
MSKKTQMTAEAAARIQSREAIKNGGAVEADTFAARAQRAAAKQPQKSKS